MTNWNRRGRLLLLLGLMGMPPLRANAQSAAFTERRREIYASQPAPRGVDRQNGSTLEDTASTVANRRREFDPSRQYFFVPSALTGWAQPAESHDSAPAPKNAASKNTVHASDPQRAAQLFSLAKEALDQGNGQWAYQLAHEVLQFDPDHADARRWIGLPNSDAPETSQIDVRKGRRRHPRFHWAAGEYLQITTPHFQITTNDRQETSLELARTLEDLHAVWEQLFFDCWSSVEALRARHAAAQTSRRGRARHRVVMFGTRDEYVTFIRQIEPQAELTRGYYHAPSRTAYFVGGEQPTPSTWCHEETHQLFHENTPTSRQVGGRFNFWIIEGIALYMESFQRCRQWHTVGGLSAERLQYARFRALREKFYLPLESLVSLDRSTLQRDPRIREIYSQAAGLSHFLMDGQQGRYRPALIRYLQQVYRGRDQLDSLSQLTEASWDDLNRQYFDFLQVSDQQLQQLDPDARLTKLCLGGSPISDAGLLSLPSLQQVTWLDLFGTQVTDDGTRGLDQATALDQLNLERTQISDTTVARLGQAVQLKQLDLSGTQITDAALQTIARLSQLEALWLANTRVSDEGLRQLTSLQQLQTLDLTGTQASQAAQDELRRALPRLSPD